MRSDALSPVALAVAEIRPELSCETCECIALAVLSAATVVGFDDDGEPHVNWNEEACQFMADNDPRLTPGRRADA